MRHFAKISKCLNGTMLTKALGIFWHEYIKCYYTIAAWKQYYVIQFSITSKITTYVQTIMDIIDILLTITAFSMSSVGGDWVILTLYWVVSNWNQEKIALSLIRHWTRESFRTKRHIGTNFDIYNMLGTWQKTEQEIPSIWYAIIIHVKTIKI